MSSIGLITLLVCLLFGGKPHKNGCTLIVEIGGNWGGVNLGFISLCGNYSETSPKYYDETRCHEFGHSIQNIILGPLFPFLVAIPSAIRYWYHRLNRNKKQFPKDWYYKVWFEKYASLWGAYYITWLEQ